MITPTDYEQLVYRISEQSPFNYRFFTRFTWTFSLEVQFLCAHALDILHGM